MTERVKVNLTEIRQIPTRPDVMALLMGVAENVVERARQAAPKRTGEGAASIHAEEVDGEVRVGWDRDHFYLGFFELGTSKMSARPFLRPALDAQYEV